MAAKMDTVTFTAANLAALKILIDTWLATGAGKVVVDAEFDDAFQNCIIFYYL
jgi:peptidyl-tRNA hydrolase